MTNSLNIMISYENGDLSEQETIDFFLTILNSGIVWKLQGSYGRTAQAMIKEGLIERKKS